MPIDTFLNSFEYDPTNFSLDAFKAKVLEEYNQDLSLRDAKVSEVTEASTKAQQEIQRLKAKNYDLLMNTPGDDATTKALGAPKAPENDETNVSIDDLFGKKE